MYSISIGTFECAPVITLRILWSITLRSLRSLSLIPFQTSLLKRHIFWNQALLSSRPKYGHSHFKSAFGINFRRQEVVKLKICKYAYLRIFSLTTSRSQKLIPKADLKRKCTHFHSKFFFKGFRSIFKKVKKWISHCIFKK